MRNVVTYILRQKEKRFLIQLVLEKKQDPEKTIKRLLVFKNRQKRDGEEDIEFVKISKRKSPMSFNHDWELLEDGRYKCIDCGVIGTQENPFVKIKPVRSGDQYKDCSWKIKK